MKKIILAAICAATMFQSSFAAVTSSGVSGSTEVVTYPTNFYESFKEANDEIKYNSRQSYRRTIYVDNMLGNDNNNGLSQAKALRSLKGLEKMSITAGDQVLLKGGQSFRGTIELIDVNSSKSSNPIHIGSYGDSKATIDFAGYPNGVLIKNTSNVIITDLKLVGNGGPAATNYMIREQDALATQRVAIFINPTTSMSKNITIDNVEINDVFFFNEDDENVPDIRPCRCWNSELNSRFGWGVRIIMGELIPSPNSTRGRDRGGLGVDGLTIRDTRVVNISHTGFKLNGSRNNSPVSNVLIDECTVYEVGGPGSQFGGVIDAVMRRCKTIRSGNRNDPRKWGRGSGMWTHSVDNFVFERNLFEGAEGIADCCGGHIDIASDNVLMQYNVSKNNAGGFVEILGRGNNNCYRYNISINDGWRNPADVAQHSYWRWLEEAYSNHGDIMYNVIGKTGALLTVNGHCDATFTGPYRSYIYNNTVVCSPSREDGFTNPFVFEISDSAQGTLIANNIYWIPEKMYRLPGVSRFFKNGEIVEHTYNRTKATGEWDENHVPIARDFTQAEIDETDLVIKNNLYKLYDPAYPNAENALPTNEANDWNTYDEAPLGGNPGFKKSNDWEYAEDLIPSNAAVVNRGIKIEKLKSDPTSYGILPKLEVEYDFFGNPITTPIIGACVVAE